MENAPSVTREIISEELGKIYSGFFDPIFLFWENFGIWVLLFFSVGGFLFVMKKSVKREELSIQKAWRLIIFFLGKRQMMLPLVYTLAKREANLSEADLEKILFFRKKSQDISMKRNPKRRLEIERDITKILISFFEKIEKTKKISEKSRLYQVEKDMEFIDRHLEDLQKIYNQTAKEWNKNIKKFPMIIFKIIFGLREFELFE